jgi:hypothetical protein
MHLNFSHNIQFSITVISILAFYVILITNSPEYFKGNNSIYFFLVCLGVIFYIYNAYYLDSMSKKNAKTNLLDYTSKLAKLRAKIGLLSLSEPREDDHGFYLVSHRNDVTLDDYFKPIFY